MKEPLLGANKASGLLCVLAWVQMDAPGGRAMAQGHEAHLLAQEASSWIFPAIPLAGVVMAGHRLAHQGQCVHQHWVPWPITGQFDLT